MGDGRRRRSRASSLKIIRDCSNHLRTGTSASAPSPHNARKKVGPSPEPLPSFRVFKNHRTLALTLPVQCTFPPHIRPLSSLYQRIDPPTHRLLRLATIKKQITMHHSCPLSFPPRLTTPLHLTPPAPSASTTPRGQKPSWPRPRRRAWRRRCRWPCPYWGGPRAPAEAAPQSPASCCCPSIVGRMTRLVNGCLVSGEAAQHTASTKARHATRTARRARRLRGRSSRRGAPNGEPCPRSPTRSGPPAPLPPAPRVVAAGSRCAASLRRPAGCLMGRSRRGGVQQLRHAFICN